MSQVQYKQLSKAELYRLFQKSGLEAYHVPDSIMESAYDRCIEDFARSIETTVLERLGLIV